MSASGPHLPVGKACSESCSVFLAHVHVLMLCLWAAAAFSFKKERFLWHGAETLCCREPAHSMHPRKIRLSSLPSFSPQMSRSSSFIPTTTLQPPCFFSADFWLTGTPGQPNTNSFPWWKSVWTVHHSRLLNPQELVQYKNVFFSYTFFLQMSSFRFLHYMRLGNVFSTGVSWHDSPLKLRINVLYH